MTLICLSTINRPNPNAKWTGRSGSDFAWAADRLVYCALGRRCGRRRIASGKLLRRRSSRDGNFAPGNNLPCPNQQGFISETDLRGHQAPLMRSPAAFAGLTGSKIRVHQYGITPSASTMATVIVSAWTSRPPHLMVGPVRDGLTRLPRLLTSQRDPSNPNTVALSSALADQNQFKTNGLPLLSPALPSHTV